MTIQYAIEDKAGETVTMGRFDSGLYDTRREAELALLRYVDAVRERETSDYGVVAVEIYEAT